MYIHTYIYIHTYCIHTYVYMYIVARTQLRKRIKKIQDDTRKTHT